MSAFPATVTFIFKFNESDLTSREELGQNQSSYVHSLTDIVFLALLVIISFLSNSVVVTAVASQSYLRRQPFYVLLITLSGIFLVDCSFNGFLSLAYMSRMTWPLGNSMCTANVFVIQLELAMVPWLVLQAAVDRYICLRHPVTYRQHCTIPWQLVSLGAIFVLAILATMLYITGFLPVRAFPARMACGAANIAAGQQAHSYSAVLLVLQTVLPVIAVLVASVVFVHMLVSDRRERQRVQARSWLQTEDMAVTQAAKTIMSHHDATTVCVWLAAGGCYVSTILPYAILSAVHQISQSTAEDDAGLQEVCRSPDTEVFLTWLRYSATWVHPVVVLTLLEDIRQEALALLTLWKTSSITPDADGLPAKCGSGHIQLMSFGRQRLKDGSQAVQEDALTAVLFPSPRGLFLRHAIGRSSSQFNYTVCDRFSECCSRDKNVLQYEQQSHSKFDAIGALEHRSRKRIAVITKPHLRKPLVRTNRTSKLSNFKTMERKKSYKNALRKFSNTNASAIISAEPIIPF